MELIVGFETKAPGLSRADSEAQLAGLLGALPLYDWMSVTVTPLEPIATLIHLGRPSAQRSAWPPAPRL
jgi:muconolactone delta-isomerase